MLSNANWKTLPEKKEKIAEDRKLTHQVQDIDHIHNTINLNAFEQQHQTVFTTLKKHTTLKKRSYSKANWKTDYKQTKKPRGQKKLPAHRVQNVER